MIIGGLGLWAASTGAQAANPGDPGFLGDSENFTVVSYAGVTNTGNTVINGNVALSPNTSITGFPPGVVTGTVHSNDATAIQALAAANIAYSALVALPFTQDLTGQNLGGLTLTAGVYHFDSSAALTGTLTLDTQLNPNAVFVFQIGSTLTASASSLVSLIGAGAGTDTNVFWQVGSSATLLTAAQFYGTILAHDSDTLTTGASVINGNVIALNGAVTLDNNTIDGVPEPTTWAMLFAGMGSLGLWSRMRRAKRAA